MSIVTGDHYLESLVKFVESQAESLIEGSLVLKLNPVGLRYVQSRLQALQELESLLVGAPVDYLRAYISDLGDHRALEQLRKILHLLPSLKVVALPPPLGRDPTPLNFLSFSRLKVLELRGCDLSTSAAKGLLELRFTLEKFICLNSTDALRHVFASRVVDVKDSPQWKRLSSVSCACNGLVLMDDSLQLIPAVEFLDISRNKFTKVDNLSKCTKLKDLDLGFNSLRRISSFPEACCQIVKLVLRNNALMSLCGIENLKSLQDLDLSYNIISSFPAIECLSGLVALQNLWLEGNPICYARWYRAHLFSMFPHPSQLKLDEKKISSTEFWKRNIIIASRRKQPANFGFYSLPADDDSLPTDDADAGGVNTKRKRTTRLASIENGEHNDSDQESLASDHETKYPDENADAHEDAEIQDLMKRIEFLKKDDSVSWLKEFKEWMNDRSQPAVGGNQCAHSQHQNTQDSFQDNTKNAETSVETSRCIPDFTPPGDPSGTLNLDPGTSFGDASSPVGSAHHWVDQTGEATARSLLGHGGSHSSISKEHHAGNPSSTLQDDSGSGPTASPVDPRSLVSLPTAMYNIITPRPLSASPGSPPHYQKDILHQRTNFEEEFMQLSADSFPVASSDSSSSCSDDDL